MMKKNGNVRMSLHGEIAGMRKGEKKKYPLSRVATVRATVSLVGLQQNRTYKTWTDRETRQLYVVRVS